MKRIWLVMLSLGLVLSFITQAMAVDVKFSGDFFAAGMYLDKTSLEKNQATGSDVSTAFYYQQLRVRTDFIVSPGLSLVTRFTALSRIWGGQRSTPGIDPASVTSSYYNSYFTSADTRAENENIAFDWAYIKYVSPLGIFTVGYQEDTAWGTVFGDNAINGTSVPKIGWSMQFGGLTTLAQIVKVLEGSNTAIMPTHNADQDNDKYVLAAIYNWKGGDAGLLYSFSRTAAQRPAGAIVYLNSLQPYVKAQIGSVKFQAELDYYRGDDKRYTGVDNKLEAINLFIDAVADFNMFYVGGAFAYLSGDNSDTHDKVEDASAYYSAVGGGLDWNPCLIMFNFERTYWAGSLSSYSAYTDSPMTNAWFFQVRAGVRPLAALDIMASVSYAVADQKPSAAWLNRTYGTEIDLTATYKITNNLSYVLGFGYWFVGDYYKGADNSNALHDDYMLINKLTLTF